MVDLDLTPFGFTPTENLAYVALLDLGPASGYALAKTLSIARANAYQALNGLVAKRAAVVVDDHPTRFRAERPDAVFALVASKQADQLDSLERQVKGLGAGVGDAQVLIEGFRPLVDVALRTVAKESGSIWCVAPHLLVDALSPAWHRRDQDNRPNMVWAYGARHADAGWSGFSELEPDRLKQYYNRDVALVVAGDSVVIAASVDGDDTRAVWASEGVLVGTVKAAMTLLTGSVFG